VRCNQWTPPPYSTCSALRGRLTRGFQRVDRLSYEGRGERLTVFLPDGLASHGHTGVEGSANHFQRCDQQACLSLREDPLLSLKGRVTCLAEAGIMQQSLAWVICIRACSSFSRCAGLDPTDGKKRPFAPLVSTRPGREGFAPRQLSMVQTRRHSAGARDKRDPFYQPP
jgi:hypothetical protein